MTTEVYVGRVRSVVLLVLFGLITLNVYYFYWLYKLNAELRAFLGGGVRPLGRVLLFVFVPVVGWFLATWWTTRSVNKAMLRSGGDRPLYAPYPVLFATLAPIIGWYVAAGMLQGRANRAWTRAVRTLRATRTSRSRLECPDCATRFPFVMNPLVPRMAQCPSCHRSGTV